MSKPMFEHRHYKKIAAAINAVCDNMSDNGVMTQAAYQYFVFKFADEMRGTNPNFNRERFIAACQGTPSNGRDKVR